MWEQQQCSPHECHHFHRARGIELIATDCSCTEFILVRSSTIFNWFLCLLPLKFPSTSMEISTYFDGSESTSMGITLLPWKLPPTFMNFHGSSHRSSFVQYLHLSSQKLSSTYIYFHGPTSMDDGNRLVSCKQLQLPWKQQATSMEVGSRPASMKVAPA